MNRYLTLIVATTALTLIGPAARAGDSSLGFGIGVIKPKLDSGGVETTFESTTYLTANFRFKLLGKLVLEPEVGYWHVTSVVNRGELDQEDLTLGANLIFVFPVAPVQIWAGAGAAAHRMSGLLGVDQVGSDTDPDTEIGYHFLGGLDYDLSDSFALFGAARYDIVSLSDDENLKERKFYGGLRFKF